MKVAIDKGPLSGGHAVRGIGFHTELLIKHLKELKEVDVDPVSLEAADISKYDVFHYPNFHPYFLTLPSKKPGPSVLTVHDLIPLIYPNHYPPGIRGRFRYFLQKRRLKNIDRVITISKTSKKDIVRFLGIPAEKIDAIYLAPREIFKKLKGKKWKKEIREKYNLPKKFVLYVGDVNYNKNLLRLALAAKNVDTPLVIVGKQAKSKDFDRSHPENAQLTELLDKFGSDKEILRVGFVPDDDLVKIYNLATLYAQPSLYEGFGLPVLEAMASGTPVLASKTQALVEIADDAAYFVDPKDRKDIEKGLEGLLEDKSLRKELVKKGKKKAEEYSWEKTAKETAEVYKKVVNE